MLRPGSAAADFIVLASGGVWIQEANAGFRGLGTGEDWTCFTGYVLGLWTGADLSSYGAASLDG